MKNKPLVTIYIVNHNYGAYIQKAINSVFNQTYKNIQLLIIDNGSTDNSRELLKKISPQNASVILQKNKGLIFANNLAIKISKGKFIMRLDADDWLDKTAISTMIKEFNKNSQVGLIFPNYYEVDERGKNPVLVERHNFNKVTLLDQPAHGACTIFRKELMEKVGFYDEEFNCQDGFDIWLKFIQKYKIKNIKKPLFFYRQHNKSLTKNESNILKTRNKILIKNIQNKKLKNIYAVIPIRGPNFEADSIVLKKIGYKPIINYTLDFAIKCKFINKIFITSPDSIFLKKLKKKYKNKIITLKRDSLLSSPDVDIDNIIFNIKKYLKKIKIKQCDAFFKLSVEGPFRDKNELNAMIKYMELFNVDKVIGARIETDNFFKHDGTGLKPLNNFSNLKLERDSIFRQINHTYLVNNKSLNKKKLKVGHIILDQLSSFMIKNDRDIQLANKLKNIS